MNAGTKKPKAPSAKKAKSAPATEGPVGTNASLSAGIVGDAAIQPGFSFTPELDRLFAAGYPHIIVLHPTPVPEEQFGTALVDVIGKNPYEIEWPANLARPLVRLLPIRAIGALQPGTTTLTDRGREIFADQSDVGDDEAEQLLRTAFAKFFSPSALRATLLLLEAVVGERAVLVLARAMQDLTRAQLHGNPSLAQLLAVVPSMLLRTSPAVHDRALGLLRALFEKHADQPHRPTTTELRAIDVLDVVVGGDEGRRRRYPAGIDHGALGSFFAPVAEARAAYVALAASGPGTWGPDVRRVFLAGKDMLAFENGWVDGYARNVTQAPGIMFETFGLVNDPRTVELMVKLHARRPLARRVEEWLVRHADLARPVLQRLSTDDTQAARSTALLQKL